jgi:hypothetical protein
MSLLLVGQSAVAHSACGRMARQKLSDPGDLDGDGIAVIPARFS